MQYTDLIVPVLVAAVAVWVYSAIAWMALPHHANDMQRAPDEEALIGAIRDLALPPGNYGFPACNSKADRKDPKLMEKWKTGPCGLLNVWGPVNMARNMALTFVVYVIVSALIGYLGFAALAPGAAFGKVMQVLGTAGILAYVFAGYPNAIWFQARRQAVMSATFDGVVQGLITGAVFAWLWPHTAAAVGA